MFTAIIVVCAVLGQGHDGHCFELKDNWGPYENVGTCMRRTEEMKKEAVVIFKNHKFPYEPVGWRCDYLGGDAA
jgi:hypothetical protein